MEISALLGIKECFLQLQLLEKGIQCASLLQSKLTIFFKYVSWRDFQQKRRKRGWSDTPWKSPEVQLSHLSEAVLGYGLATTSSSCFGPRALAQCAHTQLWHTHCCPKPLWKFLQMGQACILSLIYVCQECASVLNPEWAGVTQYEQGWAVQYKC